MVLSSASRVRVVGVMAFGAAAIFSKTTERKVQLRFATSEAAQELLACLRAR